MRVLRVSLALLLLVTTIVWAPPVAVAASPPSGPMPILSYGFEGGYPGWFTAGVNPQPPGYTPAAWWARTSQSRRTGTYGMWCAASNAANYPYYVPKTSGRATMVVPELADYYSSDMEFYYTLPSRGAADSGSFMMAWYPTATGVSSAYSYSYFPLSAAWTRVTRTLSDNWDNPFGDPVNLSREAGTFRLEFNDKIEGGSQSPTIGRGVTVDDIAFTGYMYGPVRNLAAAPAAGGMNLTWGRPYRSTKSTASEERSIVYHVWRKNADAPTDPWTHVTVGSPVTSPSQEVAYTDSGATEVGTRYKYLVVAYDSSTQTKYGLSATATSEALPQAAVDIVASANPAVIADGGSSVLTYRVTNSGTTPLFDIAVADTYGSIASGVPVSLAPGSSFECTRGISPADSVGVDVDVIADSALGAVADSDSVVVTVAHPAVSLAASVTPGVVADGDSATFTYTVTNSGDTELSSISITDYVGAVTSGVPLTLGAGDSFQVTRLVSPSTDVDNDVTVQASGVVATVSDSESVSLQLTHPALLVEATVDPDEIYVSETATFTYTVTNTGDVDLSSVSVSDYQGSVPGAPSSLPVGDSFVLTRAVTPGTSVANLVSASGTGTGKTVSSSDTVFLTVSVPNPDLAISASVTPGAIPTGETAVFSYTVTNTGGVELTSIALSDYLGAITVGVPATLAPGVSFTATRSVAPGASVSNEVTVEGMFGAFDASASDTVGLVVTNPDISVTAAAAPGVIASGSSSTFTYTIRNTGDVVLTSLAVSDESGAISAGVPVSLSPGSAFSVTRVVSPTATETRTVNVSGVGTGRTVTDSASATVRVTHPSVLLSASVAPTTVAAGDSATFTYTVTNTGDVDLSSISLTDYIGALTAGVPSSLAVGDSFQVTRIASSAANVSNLVTVQGAGLVRVVSDTKTVALAVTNPSISITGTSDFEEIVAGSPVTYDYTIKNTGNATLGSFTLSDSFGTLSVPVSVLAPGQQTVVTRVATPESSVLNTARVTAVGTGKQVASDWSRYVTVWHPAIALSTTPDIRLVSPGKTAVFDLVVKNTGDVEISTVTITVNSDPVGTIGPLRPGESGSIRYSALISSDSDLTFGAVATYESSSVSDVSGKITLASGSSVEEFPTRIAGADRIGTAIALSKQVYPHPLTSERKAVVIATGYGYADALAAASLAGAVEGPLLLVRSNAVPDAVAREITALGAEKAYIVGGEGVVTKDVRTQLERLGLTVERVAGANRYATAAQVARVTKSLAGAPDTVFVATGASFPDALAASSLAARMRAPIVLTRPTGLPSEAAQVLRELRVGTIVIAGGEGAVSTSVANKLSGSEFGSPQVIRKGGATRYDTAKELALYGRTTLEPAGFDGVYVATGSNYPDALAGGVAAAAGETWRPLTLTMTAKLSPQIADLLGGMDSVSFVTAVGGASAVSDSTRDAALALLP